MAFEKFRDAQAGSIFDAIIQIDETPRQLAGELRADSGFSGAHKSGEGDDRSWKSASHAESLDECATRRKGRARLSEILRADWIGTRDDSSLVEGGLMRVNRV